MAKRDDVGQQTAPGQPGAVCSHVDVTVRTLTRRADFLRAARAARVPCPAFLLQARRRDAGEAEGVRVGFTCSKKVGNAVARNRAKRRLRAISREILPAMGRDGWDYVLIGRAGATAQHDYAVMRDDLARAIEKAHRPPRGDTRG